jgi:hypothetical protein
MTTRFIVVGVAILLLAGCGKKPEGASLSSVTPPAAESTPVNQTSASPAAAPASVPAIQADMEPVLGQLTWSVRQYSLANHSVPGSLNVVMAAGYLTNLPPAPTGKKFAIDPKKVQVVLVNQ